MNLIFTYGNNKIALLTILFRNKINDDNKISNISINKCIRLCGMYIAQ